MPQHEPDESAVAMFANAQRCVEVRRDEPTERSAEMVEWLSSEGWARLVALARGDEWGVVFTTLEALNAEQARCAMRWAVVELARLENN